MEIKEISFLYTFYGVSVSVLVYLFKNLFSCSGSKKKKNLIFEDRMRSCNKPNREKLKKAGKNKM